MSRNAGPTTEQVLRRVKQYGGIATDFDLALTLLSKCQRVANAGLQRVKTSGTLFETKKELAIYNLRDNFPALVDIITIRQGSRMIHKIDNIKDLAAYDPNWFRAIGTQVAFWSQIGRELLVIYPTLADATNLTVTYSTLTTAYTTRVADYNTAMDLADEDVEIAAGLTELLLLLKTRLNKTTENRVKSLLEQYKQIKGSDNDER